MTILPLVTSTITCLTILAASALSANAQSKWSIEKLEAGSYPEAIVADTRKPAKNGVPGGLIATADNGDIRKAWYSGPTTRYRHAILGDDVEAGTLNVETRRGRTFRLTLGKSEVFEDLTPRIADLDGNGSNEVITIRSSVSKGASVTVYGLKGDAFIQKATTGFIGRANRWLNIAALTSMTGAKGNEIAFVSTPHIGGTLHVVRYSNGKLIRLGSLQGFSNHVIGSAEMRLSAIADVDNNGRADLAIPSADRKTLRIVGLEKSGLRQIASAALPSPIDKAIGLQKSGTKGFVVGLENGEVYLVHP